MNEVTAIILFAACPLWATVDSYTNDGIEYEVNVPEKNLKAKTILYKPKTNHTEIFITLSKFFLDYAKHSILL